MDESQRSQLVTMQRQTLAKLQSMVDIASRPRSIRVERGEDGAITGAVSVLDEDEQASSQNLEANYEQS